MNPPRPEPAVGAVCVVDGALLMVRRGHEPEAGKWSIPGGRVEAGETVSAAVAREVMEETGIAVQVGPLVGWVERIDPDHHFVILDVSVVPLSARPRPTPVASGDAAAAAWVDLDQLGELPLVAGLERFLTEHHLTEHHLTEHDLA